MRRADLLFCKTCGLSRSLRATRIHKDVQPQRERERKQRVIEGRMEVDEGTERRLEGGGKCQMVGLRHSMSDGQLQEDGCQREEE